jgi:hypothetical protein
MVTPALAGLLSAVAWFSVFVVAHIAGWRAGWENARWLVISYVACLIGSLVTVTVILAASRFPAIDPLALAVTLLTGTCLFVMYVPAVYTVLTSLSVQTLIMLHSGGGTLSEAALYGRFAGRPMLEDRIATLAASGYLVVEENRFRLSSRGRSIAAVFAFIKAFWKLGAGG